METPGCGLDLENNLQEPLWVLISEELRRGQRWEERPNTSLLGTLGHGSVLSHLRHTPWLPAFEFFHRGSLNLGVGGEASVIACSNVTWASMTGRKAYLFHGWMSWCPSTPQEGSSLNSFSDHIAFCLVLWWLLLKASLPCQTVSTWETGLSLFHLSLPVAALNWDCTPDFASAIQTLGVCFRVGGGQPPCKVQDTPRPNLRALNSLSIAKGTFTPLADVQRPLDNRKKPQSSQEWLAWWQEISGLFWGSQFPL